jgi:hypothetical protein
VAPKFGTRWNFASALQPDASNNMPNVVETCKTFARYFKPERTRIVFLNPDRSRHFIPLSGVTLVGSGKKKIIDCREPFTSGDIVTLGNFARQFIISVPRRRAKCIHSIFTFNR